MQYIFPKKDRNAESAAQSHDLRRFPQKPAKSAAHLPCIASRSP